MKDIKNDNKERIKEIVDSIEDEGFIEYILTFILLAMDSWIKK